ncbi:MAG: MFS transporter [Planctomycetota bacterium]
MWTAWTRSLIGARPGEGRATVLSGLHFFLILFSYFLVRPVREAMGVQRGLDELTWLFTLTLFVMVGANAVYALCASRMRRSLLQASVHRFFALTLLAFAGLLLIVPDVIGVRVGYAFYVWVSVFNLFIVSTFWAFMADGFRHDQAKRLFPPIAIGGTLGAIAGSSFTRTFAEELGPLWLMVGSAVLLECSLRVARMLDRRDFVEVEDLDPSTPERVPAEQPIRGGALRGLMLVSRSPYLMLICGYIGLLAIGSTLLYFTQARIVTDAADETNARIALFANIDLWTQIATLALQAFVTGRLLRGVGVGPMLVTLPVILLVGFAALAMAPATAAYSVLVLFNAAFRSGKYAIARPARETLFTVVTREEKYKAKTLLDTAVYRGGDFLGAQVFGLLAGATAVTLGGVALLAAVVAGVWGGCGVAIAILLGRRVARPSDPARGSHATPGAELQPPATATG